MKTILLCSFAILALQACQSDEVKPAKSKAAQTNELKAPESHCGNVHSSEIVDSKGQSCGLLEIMNDKQYVWFVITGAPGYVVQETDIFIGNKKTIPVDGEKNPITAEFPIRTIEQRKRQNVVYRTPITGLLECNTVALHLISENQFAQKTEAWAMGSFLAKEIFIEFCIQSCEKTDEGCSNGTLAGEFATYPQGNWNKSGEIKLFTNENFHKAFPDGIKLGCNHSIELTDFNSVNNFLPSQGKASPLSSTVKNPGAGKISNALAGETCALTLAVGFDENFSDFARSTGSLGRLVLASGPFAKWSVKDVLAESNAVLGNCASEYSASQMLEVISKINLEFERGTVSGGFLNCPN